MSAKTVKSQQGTATAGSKLVIIGSGFHRHVLSGLPHPLCDWSCLLQQLADSTGCELEKDDYSEPTQAWEKLVSQLTTANRHESTYGRTLVIIGSGFHKEVLGHSPNPLSDWTALVDRVAQTIECQLAGDDMCEPTLAWERMVSYQVQSMGNSRAAAAAEEVLKRELACILKKESDRFQAKYRAHAIAKRMSGFLKRGGGHLVSLNFDHLAYHHRSDGSFPVFALPSVTSRAVRKRDVGLLYRRAIVPRKVGAPSMVWHPHGHLGVPESLTLGYRDYGMLPAAYKHAFDCFKRWERQVFKILSEAEQEDGAVRRCALLHALAELDAGPKTEIDRAADHWVTRFMVLPVQIAGAEISANELGLRWLFVQRQLNLQRWARDAEPVFHRRISHKPMPWKSRVAEYQSWGDAWNAAFSAPAVATAQWHK